jgi:hypothetical protein
MGPRAGLDVSDMQQWYSRATDYSAVSATDNRLTTATEFRQDNLQQEDSLLKKLTPEIPFFTKYYK